MNFGHIVCFFSCIITVTLDQTFSTLQSKTHIANRRVTRILISNRYPATGVLSKLGHLNSSTVDYRLRCLGKTQIAV